MKLVRDTDMRFESPIPYNYLNQLIVSIKFARDYCIFKMFLISLVIFPLLFELLSNGSLKFG